MQSNSAGPKTAGGIGSAQGELVSSWFIPPSPLVTPMTVLLGLAGYVALCALLRFQRIQALQHRFGFTTRSSLSRMTNQDAFEIVQNFAQLEFPLFYDLGVRMALIETYAAENVAKVLNHFSDLIKPDQAPKRYEDTEIVYAAFVTFSPTSPTLHKAVARMNYLHAPYLKSGKIVQDDMLFVLYTSMTHPIKFLNLYEWRPLTQMEMAALGTLWKYVGDLMEIDYKGLLQKESWADGIEFIEDVSAWASKHEDKEMRPMKEIHDLGEVLLGMLQQSYPSGLAPLVYSGVCVLMGTRLRRCFGVPEPGLAITTFTFAALLLRKLAVRYLCLPRFIPVKYISNPDAGTGRIHHFHYMKEPWYCAPTLWGRWNLEALLTWATGGMIPGDGGSRMKPEGLLFEDLGPLGKMGKGEAECEVLQEKVRKAASTGCPFSAVAGKC